MSNQRAGYLLTHKYRGRGAYAGHALDAAAHQAAGAAEAVIREGARLYRLDDLSLREVRALDAERQRVAFLDADGGAHCAEVTTGLSAPRLTSCGDAPKPMPQHDVAVLAAG